VLTIILKNCRLATEIPLVTSGVAYHSFQMNRIKTLSLPLISALVASAVTPASAQISMELSSQKEYRQSEKGVQFRGGSFVVNLNDGDGIYVGGCARSASWPPNVPLDPCPLGSTAFLTFGRLDGATSRGPYFSVSNVIPAIIIEPRRPDLAFLRAAPPSLLKRPAGGFKDSSFALYFNLHTTGVREYVISRYTTSRGYTASERERFEKEIVPGVYYYSFPRLGRPDLVAPISAVIYPMAEGRTKLNRQLVGVDFNGVTTTKPVWRKGFMELSYIKPNVLSWKGLDRTVVIAAADKLYLSMRVLSDRKDPLSATDLIDNDLAVPQSIFPGFASGGDPRVLLKNPLVSSFTMPPIFPGGTRGVLELELQRTLATTGVTFDASTRKFQIPVVVVNRYSEYAEVAFEEAKSKISLLEDYDNDGYNNLNEWILDSSASDASSIPEAPVARANAAEFNAEPVVPRIVRDAYFGFTVVKKLETVPAVKYTLQRSRDGGTTWEKFVTDDDWSVTTVRLDAGAFPRRERDPEQIEIRVESKVRGETDLGGGLIIDGDQIQPPGTEDDIYRVKIVQS
jgi:hypothetical protein